MYVIKKMQLNKFVERPIVSNRALFIARGECPATIVSKDTSDCYNEPTIEGASKTKILGLASEITKTAIAKHKEGEKAADMSHLDAKER